MIRDLNRIRETGTPLVLQSRGSFFVGGERIEQNFVELGSRRPADQVTINQMYVEYMVPAGATLAPVVMIHGAGQSGQSYDTTPDGRMGWYEYFVRRSHPVFVIDQIGRARSGFNQAIFNNVKAGLADPGEQPAIVRMGDRFAAWVNFRIGPEPGIPYADTQFPMEAAEALSRQGIPDLTASLPSPNPNHRSLSSLVRQLGGAVLLGHSQSGAYPLEAALLDPSNINAMVMVEPGQCGADAYSDAEIATLATVPLLVLFGDHLATPTYLPGPGWEDRLQECRRLVERLREAQGRADLIHLPAQDIHGNSHMIMQDRNNQQIADIVIDWISDIRQYNASSGRFP
ncbi:hypothetical protein [Burkholderia multivorans]|uniref:hypothetical protein n=1 Tax=Burkholderia multivorans TaxID=87883 RepID=UPI002018E0EB|nr:hypothetical protein [Burkholderia multivorans]MCO1367041.1 hypothetical protein [Burkholderia multivorans]MCO1376650.1 hypothetical protein [Burkholderia multivorans]UQP18602.1 hypothetical protein L0Y98_10010 [Burkholderia multivorans]UQP86571.1 hypothetical protein L0Y91_09980 [Burkholderia multivorans]